MCHQQLARSFTFDRKPRFASRPSTFPKWMPAASSLEHHFLCGGNSITTLKEDWEVIVKGVFTGGPSSSICVTA